jgi:long-chain acyl-CoA synthetase
MEKEKAVAIDTVAGMFWNGVLTRGPKTAFRQKNFGIWQAVSWDELGRIAREIGMGLVSLGYEPGEVVSILANTRKEWVYADLGALGAAGVVNGIYPTDASSQVEYLLSDSASVYAFVEDEEQLDKVLEVRGRLPRLRRTFVLDMEGLHDFSDPGVMSLDALRALGREFDAAHPG